MKKLSLLFFLLCSFVMVAQKEVTGMVKDNQGNPLPGVNIIEKGTSNGTSTDMDGKYKIRINEDSFLVFSYIGYTTVTKSTAGIVLNVTLTEEGSQNLEEVVVTGTRTAPRSNTTTALPIDVLSSKDLVSTGQATFDKALQYKIPSFNTVQTPVNDATSLLDPYEIRNMGPSRTLILINGKRKNLSSLVYVQTSPGRGETGADISAIPTDAIERVEILRDGASAQYGSDAIAGVMNIILKKNNNSGSATLRSGITTEGDGEMLGISINNGTTVGEKGFLNYTLDFSKVKLANRPGTVDAGTKNLGPENRPLSGGEYADFVYTDPDNPKNYPNEIITPVERAKLLASNAAGINDVNSFLAKYPDAGNINGSPETLAAKFLVNGGRDLSDNTQLYYNAAYVYKKVSSFANYRTPYWRTLDPTNPYLNDFFGNGNDANPSYKGYVPTFIGDLNDYNATLGFKNQTNGWNTDGSITVGGNSQIYTVENSQNRSDLVDANGNNVYKENSPITFKPGGTKFNHVVGNIDISKNLSDKVSIGFGSEFRTETFEVIEGDKASWDGLGADSFAGNRPENSGKWNRYNLGFYADIAFDVTEDFLLNGTLRHEEYSDFGGATVWKLSTRYKFIDDKITLRGSISTGFRAPTLHQIYTQKAQYSFVAGQGIQVSGIINNVSPQARILGIPSLKAENSTNITVGIGAKPSKNFNFTIDYYNIKVEDRIVLGDRQDKTINGVVSNVAWFSNSFDSRTSGLDFVANYNNLEVGSGKLGFNLSGNITLQNERISDVRNNSFGPILDALTFTSRPETKWILGANYEIGKFGFSLNNTYFGKTTFKQDGMSNDLRTEFIPKIVTDLGVNFNATDKLTLALNVNNLLNVLPEWEFKAENAAGQAILNDPLQTKAQFNLITFNGRYSQMTYDGYHFSQLGTMLNLSLNYKF